MPVESRSTRRPRTPLNLEVLPLNACKNGGHIVSGTPAVLQDVQAKFSGGVNVGVEHLAYKFDTWRLVRILLLEMHDQAKRAIFEGCICRAYDDSIPLP